MASTHQPFRFFDLPPEVRVIVYQLAMVEPPRFDDVYSNLFFPNLLQRPGTVSFHDVARPPTVQAAFTVSCKFREEALIEYLKVNKAVFWWLQRPTGREWWRESSTPSKQANTTAAFPWPCSFWKQPIVVESLRRVTVQHRWSCCISDTSLGVRHNGEPRHGLNFFTVEISHCGYSLHLHSAWRMTDATKQFLRSVFQAYYVQRQARGDAGRPFDALDIFRIFDLIEDRLLKHTITSTINADTRSCTAPVIEVDPDQDGLKPEDVGIFEGQGEYISV